MTRDDILATLKSLKEEVREKYNAEIKGIFGSRSRGEVTKNSDLDVLVNFLAGATLFDLTALSDFLEQEFDCKVDVVSQNALRDELKSSINEDLRTV